MCACTLSTDNLCLIARSMRQVLSNLARYHRNPGMHKLALEVIAHSLEAHQLAGLLKEFQKVSHYRLQATL